MKPTKEEILEIINKHIETYSANNIGNISIKESFNAGNAVNEIVQLFELYCKEKLREDLIEYDLSLGGKYIVIKNRVDEYLKSKNEY